MSGKILCRGAILYRVYMKESAKWFAITPKNKILGFCYFCIFYIARQSRNVAKYIVRNKFGGWVMQCLYAPSEPYLNSSFRNYYLFSSFLLSTTYLKRGDSTVLTAVEIHWKSLKGRKVLIVKQINKWSTDSFHNSIIFCRR